MNRIFTFCLLATIALANPDNAAIKTFAAEFDSVNTLVRDNKIDKAQALKNATKNFS